MQIIGTSSTKILICVLDTIFLLFYVSTYFKFSLKKMHLTAVSSWCWSPNVGELRYQAIKKNNTFHFVGSEFFMKIYHGFLCVFLSRSRIMFIIIICERYHFLSFIIHSLLYKCMLCFTLVFSIPAHEMCFML